MPMHSAGTTHAWYSENMNDNIVITGIGVVSSIGTGKDAFWQALKEGRSGIKPVTLFDTSSLKVRLGGEVSDFKPEEILGPKGLRTLDRATKLLLCAGSLALADAKLDINDESSNSVGTCIGTTLGHLWSSSEFDKSALREGPRYVNPAEFPNTVMNSPASQLNIRFKIKGPCATILSGFTSSLDAIEYSLNLIRNNRAEIVLAGALEDLAEQNYLGFYKTQFLAGLRGQEISSPFDKRRNGAIFGEGSGVVVLEKEESARKRGARIYARISGYGTSFYPYKIDRYEPQGKGLKKAVEFALSSANLAPKDIDYISSAANSTVEGDLIETDVIKEVFKEKAAKLPISSIKSMLGETYSAAGILQLVSAVASINDGFIPPTINYEQKDASCDLDCVPNKARPVAVNNVLIDAFGPSGANSCLIVSKHK